MSRRQCGVRRDRRHAHRGIQSGRCSLWVSPTLLLMDVRGGARRTPSTAWQVERRNAYQSGPYRCRAQLDRCPWIQAGKSDFGTRRTGVGLVAIVNPCGVSVK